MINEIKRMQQLAGIRPLNELEINKFPIFTNFEEIVEYVGENNQIGFEDALEWAKEEYSDKFILFINTVLKKYRKLATPYYVDGIIELRYFGRSSENEDKTDIAMDDLYLDDPEITWDIDLGGLETEVSKIFDTILL